jgi:hypothetical protein
MTMQITNEQMDRATQRRLQMTVALDAIISQAKMAKKRVGAFGGNHRVRDHMAAMQRQMEVVAELLSEAQSAYEARNDETR